MLNFYRNPEVKSITFKFLIFNLVLIIIFSIFIKIEINNMKQLYINQNIAIAGKILKKNPSFEKDIIPIFTKGASKESLDSGKSILAKYGFNENINYIYIKPFNDYYKDLTVKAIIFIIFSFLFIYLITIKGYKNIFTKVQTISSSAEKIIDGDFHVHLEENLEGNFYILNHQFNEMAKKLAKSIEVLKKEKLFLKNIISDISHQLKTPLSSLILFNEILATEKDIEPDVKNDFIEKSGEQLSRMEWLIINLLKLARLEADAINFNIICAPINTTIEKSISPLLIYAKEKNQTINIENKKNLLLNHDVNWTSEALSNIIKNSIEHTEPNGTISIKFEETPLCIEIFIKDNGEGISSKDLPRIFDRFYKSENSTNPTSIGIGLSLSKAIIEIQGGSISVDSTSGKGTEFTITFLKSII